MAGIPNKYKKAGINIVLIGVIIWGIFLIVPKIILLFMPFFIGRIFSWLVNPVVNFLEEKIKIKRNVGATFIMISLLGGIGILIYTVGNYLVKSASVWVRKIPFLWERMEIGFLSISKNLSKLAGQLPRQVVDKAEGLGEQLGEELSLLVGKISIPTADTLSEMAYNLPGTTMAVVMCFLSTYFFLVSKTNDGFGWDKWISKECKEKCLVLKEITVDVIFGYVKAQLKIEIWVYLILTVGFMILKVEYGYLVAIPIAILDLLPVFGTGTVLIPWSIIKILSGEYFNALGLIAIWIVGQLVRQMIQPKMIGDSMGLAPIPTLILLYLGYKTTGFVGMIAAVPLGMLALAMNEAGFFDNTKKSFLIVWQGVQEFRRFTKKD